jgi:hypothetical protein
LPPSKLRLSQVGVGIASGDVPFLPAHDAIGHRLSRQAFKCLDHFSREAAAGTEVVVWYPPLGLAFPAFCGLWLIANMDVIPHPVPSGAEIKRHTPTARLNLPLPLATDMASDWEAVLVFADHAARMRATD